MVWRRASLARRTLSGRRLFVVLVVVIVAVCLAAVAMWKVPDTELFRRALSRVDSDVVTRGGYQVSGTDTCRYLKLAGIDYARLRRSSDGADLCSADIAFSGEAGSVGRAEIGFDQDFDAAMAKKKFDEVNETVPKPGKTRKLPYGDESVGIDSSQMYGGYEILALYSNVAIDFTVEPSTSPTDAAGHRLTRHQMVEIARSILTYAAAHLPKA